MQRDGWRSAARCLQDGRAASDGEPRHGLEKLVRTHVRVCVCVLCHCIRDGCSHLSAQWLFQRPQGKNRKPQRQRLGINSQSELLALLWLYEHGNSGHMKPAFRARGRFHIQSNVLIHSLFIQCSSGAASKNYFNRFAWKKSTRSSVLPAHCKNAQF